MRFLLMAAAALSTATPILAQGREWTSDRFAQCVSVERFDDLSTERHASTEPCRRNSQVLNDESNVTISVIDPFVAETAMRANLNRPAFAIMFDASYHTNNNVFVRQGSASADFYRAVFILNGQQHDREFALSQAQDGGCESIGRGALRTTRCAHRELMLMSLTADDIAAIRSTHHTDPTSRLTFRLHSRNAGSADVWILTAEIVGMVDRAR